MKKFGRFLSHGLSMGMTCGWILILASSGLMAQTVFFEENFETGRLNPAHWTASTDHQDGVCRVSVAEGGKGAASSGLYGFAMGKSKRGERAVNTLDLRHDLSGFRDVELLFHIKENYEQTDLEYDGIWFSDDDGANFRKVFDFDADNWDYAVYGPLPPIDVDALAKATGLRLTSQFVIRFQMAATGAFSESSHFNQDGIFIDDVVLRTPDRIYASLPFNENFESGKFGPWWAWTPSQKVAPGALVDVRSELGSQPIALEGFYSAVLGKISDGVFVTNALDLHLDLSGYDQVAMSFLIGHRYEDTHAEDGIWFSDDGGEHFLQVFSFYSSGWDSSMGSFPSLDVDQLANERGLNLTDKFVIRFQQRGEDNFLGSYYEQDGLILDDIKIYSDPLEYATLPFQDDFEQGKLGPSWAWRFPEQTAPGRTTLPSGFAKVASNVEGIKVGRDSFWGLALGKTVRSQWAANAVDLHVKLADYQDAKLTFWILNMYDEPQAEDGIWISNDGGNHFEKILEYSTLTTKGVYVKLQIDLREAASRRNLAFTDEFVIRVQQYGNSSFAGCCESSRDGIFIDDVSVTGTLIPDAQTIQNIVPWVVNNAAFSSRIAIFNDGYADAALALTAIDQAGNQQEAELQLAGKELFSMASGDLFPGLSGYSLQVSSNVDTLFTSFMSINEEPISGGSSPSQTTGSQAQELTSHLLFGYLPDDAYSAVVLVAPFASSGQIPVRLKLYGKDSGDLLATKEVQVFAKRPFAALVRDLFEPGVLTDDVVIKASSLNGALLAGTAFIFNDQREPSMATATPRDRD